jgi:hypothetical protein
MEPVVATITTSALKKGLELAICGLLTNASGAIGDRIKSCRTRNTIQNATGKLSQVRMVKTIWQVDKPARV